MRNDEPASPNKRESMELGPSTQTGNPASVHDQFAKIAPYYHKAYQLESAIPDSLEAVAANRWRRNGEDTVLGAAVAIIETLDEWRQSAAATQGAAEDQRSQQAA